MTSILRNIIGAAWRRRFLILAPFLLLSAASIAASIMLPKTYTSSALLLLQEDASDAIASRQRERFLDLRARVAALEALLRSDQVLSEVIRRHNGVDPDANPKVAAVLLEELRERLTISISGTQFVEISLRGSKPVALRDELDQVVETLFALLLLPQNTTMSAPDFLAERKVATIARLEQERALLDREAGDLSMAALGAKVEERNAAERVARRTRADAETALADLQEAAFAILGQRRELRALDIEIAALTTGLEGASPEQTAQIQKQVTQLEGLRSLEERAVSTKRAADAALARLTAADQELSAHKDSVDRRAAIAAALTVEKQGLEEFRGRFNSQREKTLVILAAPDRLTLVDAPKVPERPSNSTLKILIAGLAAGIGLGCGLAVIAEQLDQSVRGEEDLAGVTQLPVLARLPGLRPAEQTVLSNYGAEPRGGAKSPPAAAIAAVDESFSAQEKAVM